MNVNTNVKNKRRIALISFIILIAFLCISVFVLYFLPKWKMKNEYSIVHLANGKVYIGKLSFFPSLEIRDAYIFQAIAGANDKKTKTNFQLVPLKDTLWAPKRLYLNYDQIIFYGPISESSKISKAIKNAKNKQ